MIFGLKQIPFRMTTLLNDDVQTPTQLSGRKIIPILELPTGEIVTESLDIVRLIDQQDGAPVLGGPQNPAISGWIAQASSTIFKLAIPRWAEAPLGEFRTPAARGYFVENKSRQMGSFTQHLANSPALIREAEADLLCLEPLLVENGDGCNGPLSLDDILLFPILRALSIVIAMDYPPKVEAYRQQMAAQAHVVLHDGISC